MAVTTADIEDARIDYQGDAAEAEYWRIVCPVSPSCRSCDQLDLWTEASALAIDMVTAMVHPVTGWRDRQAAIWERRAEEAVRGSVAWG